MKMPDMADAIKEEDDEHKYYDSFKASKKSKYSEKKGRGRMGDFDHMDSIEAFGRDFTEAQKHYINKAVDEKLLVDEAVFSDYFSNF